MSGLTMESQVRNLKTTMEDLMEVVAQTSLHVAKTSAEMVGFKEVMLLSTEQNRIENREIREQIVLSSEQNEREILALLEEMRSSRKQSEREIGALREKSAVELHAFQEEMRRSREQSEAEIHRFTQEMVLSREQSELEIGALREKSAGELHAFKEEMRSSREKSESEMNVFQEEMRRSREKSENELHAFREEMRLSREEIKRENREFNRSLGEIANKHGRLVEDIVAPSLCRAMKLALGFDENTPCLANERVKRLFHGNFAKLREFDVVVECADYVMINETKSSLSSKDVNNLIAVIAQAREYFPEFRDRKIVGSVASLRVSRSVVNFATKKGIFAFGIGDELMDLQNPPGFKPAVW